MTRRQRFAACGELVTRPAAGVKGGPNTGQERSARGEGGQFPLRGRLGAGLLALLAWGMIGWGAASAWAQPISADLQLPPEVGAPDGWDESEVEIRTQGPLHEAFAAPSTLDPADPVIVDREPPPPVDEIPPDYRPDGQDVVWLPGYWYFDAELDDFLWISGVWRQAPPGRQWEPGYWVEVEEGYQWVPGAWLRQEVAAEPQYYAPPPASQEIGPSSPAPSDDHFWIPGTWVYQNRDYVWRAGYWAPAQVGWVWVPPRYVWTVNGCLYVDGYWDYPFDRRGQIFAPVYFRRPVYRHVGFRFTPWVVVDTGRLLTLHLWVNPHRGFYYYGNYYDPRFSGVGFVSWVQFGARPRYYDPYFHYCRWRFGPTFITNLNTWHGYYVRHPHLRPRPTYREQLLFAQATTNHRTVVTHSVYATSLRDAVGRRGTATHLTVNNTNFVRISNDERTRISQRNENWAEQRDRRRDREWRGREELLRETGGDSPRLGRGGRGPRTTEDLADRAGAEDGRGNRGGRSEGTRGEGRDGPQRGPGRGGERPVGDDALAGGDERPDRGGRGSRGERGDTSGGGRGRPGRPASDDVAAGTEDAARGDRGGRGERGVGGRGDRDLGPLIFPPARNDDAAASPETGARERGGERGRERPGRPATDDATPARDTDGRGGRSDRDLGPLIFPPGRSEDSTTSPDASVRDRAGPRRGDRTERPSTDDLAPTREGVGRGGRGDRGERAEGARRERDLGPLITPPATRDDALRPAQPPTRGPATQRGGGGSSMDELRRRLEQRAQQERAAAGDRASERPTLGRPAPESTIDRSGRGDPRGGTPRAGGGAAERLRDPRANPPGASGSRQEGLFRDGQRAVPRAVPGRPGTDSGTRTDAGPRPEIRPRSDVQVPRRPETTVPRPSRVNEGTVPGVRPNPGVRPESRPSSRPEVRPPVRETPRVQPPTPRVQPPAGQPRRETPSRGPASAVPEPRVPRAAGGESSSRPGARSLLETPRAPRQPASRPTESTRTPVERPGLRSPATSTQTPPVLRSAPGTRSALDSVRRSTPDVPRSAAPAARSIPSARPTPSARSATPTRPADILRNPAAASSRRESSPAAQAPPVLRSAPAVRAAPTPSRPSTPAVRSAPASRPGPAAGANPRGGRPAGPAVGSGPTGRSAPAVRPRAPSSSRTSPLLDPGSSRSRGGAAASGGPGGGSRARGSEDRGGSRGGGRR